MAHRNKKVEPALVAELQRRHERVQRDALSWLRRHRATHQVIADKLRVCRCTLTKFLNGDPGFRPTPDRPAKVKLLEALELLFVTYELVDEKPLQPPCQDPPDDDYTLAHNHEMRLRHLSNNFDGLQGLVLVGELCAQARNGPPGYRAGMAARTLLRIAGFVSRPEASAARRALLRYTRQRVLALEEAAAAAASRALLEDSRLHAGHRALGYAGYALTWCGLHMPDDGLVGDGLERSFAAAATKHTKEDGHFSNLLRLCDELLRRRHALGDPRAARAAELAIDRWNAVIAYVLANRTYDILIPHWRRAAPELLRRLPAGEAAR